jgi:hypothetical protein
MSTSRTAGSMDHASAERPAVDGGRLGRFSGTYHMAYPHMVRVEYGPGGERPPAASTGTAEFRAGRRPLPGAEVVQGPTDSALPLTEGEIDPRHHRIKEALEEVYAAHETSPNPPPSSGEDLLSEKLAA